MDIGLQQGQLVPSQALIQAFSFNSLGHLKFKCTFPINRLSNARVHIPQKQLDIPTIFLLYFTGVL